MRYMSRKTIAEKNWWTLGNLLMHRPQRRRILDLSSSINFILRKIVSLELPREFMLLSGINS